jgi:hypothetical protein
VPETKGQLEVLYQFTSTKTGAAIQTTLAIAAGLVKSSSSRRRSGSCESDSKKQRTADTRDVTYLEAAAFAHEDKTNVLYGADAVKEQQLYKLEAGKGSEGSSEGSSAGSEESEESTVEAAAQTQGEHKLKANTKSFHCDPAAPQVE